MGTEKVNKQMFELFKASMDAMWSSATVLQGQAERMAAVMMEQYATMQAEGHKQLEAWMEESKKRQSECKKFYEEGMRRLADALKDE